MMSYEEILKRMDENIDKIKSFGVKEIGVFGSYLRNEQTPDSDIHVLVEFSAGKKTFDNYMDLKFFLEELYGCEIDLVIRQAVKPELKQYILESTKYAQGI